MIRLIDTDGDPLLIHEMMIVRVVCYRPPDGVSQSELKRAFKILPKSIIIDALGNGIPVTESIEEIENLLKGYAT